MAGLTTHVLDIAHGVPARGVRIEFYHIEGGERHRLSACVTNADGRTDAPLLDAASSRVGEFELVFYIGDYFAEQGVTLAEPAFLNLVPVRFALADATAHYHVPLLVSPWSYSTYRGS